MVLQVHRFIITLPPQVEREQPIYFIDAFGKESAFFLEWIYSAEVRLLHHRQLHPED